MQQQKKIFLFIKYNFAKQHTFFSEYYGALTGQGLQSDKDMFGEFCNVRILLFMELSRLPGRPMSSQSNYVAT